MNNSPNKRTIEFVLNKENGSTVYASSIFLKKENEIFNLRSELQKAIKGVREPLFICYFCGQTDKQYIRIENIEFDKINRDTLIELRNEFGITNFQRLFLKPQNKLFDTIFEFFKNEYTFSKQDLVFIKKEFDRNKLTTEKLNNHTIIYYISVSIFLNRLSSNKELYNSYNSSVQQLLFAILSIKQKRVFGSNLSNLIQVINHHTNLKNNRVVFFDVIVKAIETYYNTEDFCKEVDKKGLLKPKILNANNWKPQQETKYNKIVSIVFPEIKFD